jgi:lipoate-protein ligase A
MLTWLIWDAGNGEAAANMATDEALLELAAEHGLPVLRFYGWKEKAATFGYFQPFREVAAMTPLRPLIRRPTGGGLVPHDDDWTYSLVFPPGHAWHALRAVESYAQVHAWLRDAMNLLRFPTELAPHRRIEAPGQCFAGAEQFDLLHQSRKIAGAAQRRNRWGLLIQGSLQPVPAGLHREAWHRAMGQTAGRLWGIEWQPFTPTAGLRTRVNELTVLKYSRVAYNERR